MRRTFGALAMTIVALAAGATVPGTASANHRCFVRVGTTPQGPAEASRARSSLEATVGETVFIYFYGLEPGPATVDWLVDGVPVTASRRVFSIPEVYDPERGGPAAAQGAGFGVTLQPADVGTVTLRPSQSSAEGDPSCGDRMTPWHEATIEVARSRMPDTATRGAASPVSEGVPIVLFPLAGLAALVATGRARSARRRTSAAVGRSGPRTRGLNGIDR
jgi:hypothetical protein